MKIPRVRLTPFRVSLITLAAIGVSIWLHEAGHPLRSVAVLGFAAIPALIACEFPHRLPPG